MNISVEPRKNNGTTSSILIGDAMTYPNMMIINIPIHLEWTPVRYVKIVCEKIYDPVNPNVNPLHKLPIPTVFNSMLVSSASPTSIAIAA
jgi:hypothetical protein